MDATLTTICTDVDCVNGNEANYDSDDDIPLLVTDEDSSSESEDEQDSAADDSIVAEITDVPDGGGVQNIAKPITTVSSSMSSNRSDEVKIIYANIRGLHQGAAQLRHIVATFNLMFAAPMETHLDGHSLDAETLPPGYRAFARKDQTKHEGGVLIIGLEMLLVNELKFDKYSAPCLSEIVGVEYQDFFIFGAYTQSSPASPVLFDSLCHIRD